MSKLNKPNDLRGDTGFFAGGGEMSQVILKKDWSKTPLGPIETWSLGLRTAVSLVLNSNFPISMAWGEHHTQIYNDGYWPICGDKHPTAMGQDFTECWASAFPVIGDAFWSAYGGKTAYLEDQRMFLDRLGYLEETCFTFSFSPIRDENGAVAGLFHPVNETTSKMLSQRRSKTLRDLTAIGLVAKSFQEAIDQTVQILAYAVFDVPFALFYQIGTDAQKARLVGKVGLDSGFAACPSEIDISQGKSLWPLAQVQESGSAILINDLAVRIQNMVCEPYPEPVKQARLLPLTIHGHSDISVIMILGISPRLPENEDYRSFHELLASTIGNVVSSALSIEAEKRRIEALAELDRAKTIFFSNISHEFRTPLTLMLGPLEDELADSHEPLSESRRERLATAHRNSLRLLKLVNTLLDYSLIEAGRINAHYQPTDLGLFTTELASMFQPATKKAGIELLVDCPALPDKVYIDREMWEKIVLNLLSNAFKHTFTGQIRISLTWKTDQVELTVQDSGVGIPQEELSHLFERFHRVKGSRSRTVEGTGIGLALVKELAQLHGGSVEVESETGKGSTFRITAKTGRAHLPESQTTEASATVSYTQLPKTFADEATRLITKKTGSAIDLSRPLTLSAENRARIVWADDNADMRDYVSHLLGEVYEVIAVADGAEALALTRETLPDLVLTDVMMPVMDGFELLRELRATESTRQIPVIFLSARAGEEAAVGGLESGADDYLVKPFTARELMARVATHINLAKLRRSWTAEQESVEKFKISERNNLEQLEMAEKSRRALLGILEDQQQSEEALRKSESEFRTLAESMPQIVWTTRADGWNIYFNQQWMDYTGMTLEESYGHGWNKPFHPDDQQRAWDAWQNAVDNNGTYSIEVRLRRFDGEYRWWLVRGIPQISEQGEILKWFGTCTDIEDIKQTQKALSENEELLRLSTELANVAAWEFDFTTNLMTRSKNHDSLYGLEFQENWEYGTFLNATHPDDRELSNATIQNSVAPDGPDKYKFDFRVIYPDQTVHWLNVIGEVIKRNDKGEGTLVRGFIIDITDRKRAEEELRISEEKFSNAFHVGPAGLTITRISDGKFLEVNDSFLKMFEFEREDVIGHTSIEVNMLSPEARSRLIKMQLETGGLHNAELETKSKTGKTVHLLFSSKPITIMGEDCHVTTMIDVTDQKQIEEAFKETAANLRSVIDNREDSIWSVDRNFNYIIFNKTYENIIYNLHQIRLKKGMNSRDTLNEAELNFWVPLFESVFAGESITFEFSHVINGETRYFRTSLNPIYEDENITGATGLSIDITDIKKAEKAVQESEEKYRSIYENSSVAILLTALDGTILTANDFACRIFDRTEKEICEAGRTGLLDLSDPRLPLMLEKRRTEGKATGELTFLKKDGTKFPGEISSVVFTDQEGNQRTSMVIRDLSEQKKAEQEIVALNQSLEQKVKERTAQLEAVNKELETFTYSVSHDLKAPLRGIDGFSRLLQDIYGPAMNDEAQSFIKTIRSSTTLMNQLIDDLLNYSRLERSPLRIEAIRISEVIDTIVTLNKAELDAHQFKFETDSGEIVLAADSRAITIALRNVIENAIKFTKNRPNPRVKVVVTDNEQSWVISVADNGIGFNMKYHQRIFEIFQRLERAEDFPGTGIGLAMVYKAMQRIKGRVWAESAPGEGSVFYLEIPKHE
ncbi:MAG: PAS domain S-box protein [Bacteroidales bacterium]|nr:PAS domain S-box protein [Bacteroidales bacterium]